MTATPQTASSPGIRSLIPARIDRLPWSRFHTRLVVALGVAWVLDGMGIGGEYAAFNSAIDEMIPAKFRGRVDLAVNGTYWAGAFLGTIVTLVALNNISTIIGWRVAYLVGPVLALVIIFVRRHLPVSPCWQI